MSAIKPCPLFPGLEPECAEVVGVVNRPFGRFWQVAINDDDEGYIEGPRRATAAEAITAWNEWMESIEVKP